MGRQCLDLLLKGSLSGNKVAMVQLNKMNEDTDFQKMSGYMSEMIEDEYDRFQATTMLKQKNYEEKYLYITSVLEDNTVNILSTQNVSFILGLSLDEKFILQLKNDIGKRKKIQYLIQNKFEKINGNFPKAKSLRMSLIRLFSEIASASETLAWIAKIKHAPNLSINEKAILQKNSFRSSEWLKELDI